MPKKKKSPTAFKVPAQKVQRSVYRPKLRYGDPDPAFMERVKTLAEGDTLTLCLKSPIPRGFVVVGVTTDLSRSHEVNNALIIKRPGPQETICAGSPIPTGYVIVGQTTNIACSNQVNNALIIKTPGEQEIVCAHSTIPEGYEIIGTTTSLACGHDLNNALNIRKISAAPLDSKQE